MMHVTVAVNKESGKCPIKVYVSTIDKQMLAGGVCGFFGEQKYRHAGDFLGFGHALPERDIRGDVAQLFLRVGESRDPLVVLRSHDFSRNDRIDANAVGQQFERPFPRESELRALRGGVAGSSALACNSCL